MSCTYIAIWKGIDIACRDNSSSQYPSICAWFALIVDGQYWTRSICTREKMLLCTDNPSYIDSRGQALNTESNYRNVIVDYDVSGMIVKSTACVTFNCYRLPNVLNYSSLICIYSAQFFLEVNQTKFFENKSIYICYTHFHNYNPDFGLV